MANRADIVLLLLENGANSNFQIKHMSVLHLAARMGFIEVAKTLLTNGADVKKPDREGRTPLHKAAEYGRIEIIKMLAKHHANLLRNDDYGMKPLDAAEDMRQTESVDLLRKMTAKHAI